jgi:hypothetical protein
MLGKVIKWIGAFGLFLSVSALFIAHPLPSGPAMFKGTAKAHQLLEDNPDEQELVIPRSDLKAVLRDVRHQRQFFISSWKTALFFNFACVVLCFLLYRYGKWMQRSIKSADATPQLPVDKE